VLRCRGRVPLGGGSEDQPVAAPLECEKDSEAELGAWLPAPLPTPRTLPDHGALWPLAVGVEKDLGGIDV